MLQPNDSIIADKPAANLFLQIDPQMLPELGLPLRLLTLYGRMRLHAGKSGKCFVRHSVLAKEIGLRSKWNDRQVRKPLNQLRQLRLISWRRGRYCNYFDVLSPDRNWVPIEKMFIIKRSF